MTPKIGFLECSHFEVILAPWLLDPFWRFAQRATCWKKPFVIIFSQFWENFKKPVFKTTPCVQKIKFLKSWEKVDSDGRIEIPVAELVGIATKIVKIGWKMHILRHFKFLNFDLFQPNLLFNSLFSAWSKICQNCPFWTFKCIFSTILDPLSSFLASKIEISKVFKIFMNWWTEK